MFAHFHVRLSRRAVLEVSAGLGLLLAVVLTCWMSSFCALADEVRANTLRLHVQANSDSEADQTLKLTVRDAVLEEAAALFAGAKDEADARRIAEESLPQLQACVERTLKEEGSSLSARVYLTEMYFDTTCYEDFTLPATPESARTAHGQPSPPAYARTDSYTPGFPLQFPLPGQSRKTSGYGWRTDPMGGLGDDFHIGNDLAAAQGTPVLAAADGVVRMAGSHKSYGNYLRILHADGDETLYAHMQYLFVKAGECVTAGQILGTVGETGNATGPHLHFELLHAGVRYDPTRALAKAGLQAEP